MSLSPLLPLSRLLHTNADYSMSSHGMTHPTDAHAVIALIVEEFSAIAWYSVMLQKAKITNPRQILDIDMPEHQNLPNGPTHRR